MDGDRPQRVRTVEARLLLDLPDWVLVEMERHSLERPGETFDRFVSQCIRQWAEERRAERVREPPPVLWPATRREGPRGHAQAGH